MFANRDIGGFKIPCVAFLIVCIVLIFVYGAYRRGTGTTDFLEKKIVDSPGCPGFDGWAVAHILFFGILGFIYPGHYVQALLIGIGWEIFENTLGTHKITMSGVRLQLMGATDKDGRPVEQDEGNSWWYGRESDVCYDMIGYIIGSAVGAKLWPPKKGENVFMP